MLFTRKRKLPNIELKKLKKDILFESKFNFLEIYFQKNGTYNKQCVLDRYSKRMNILLYVKSTSCRVEKEPILTLYGALIRSVVEYGMEASFNPSIAHDIQKIQNEALRLCTGALQSTPTCSFLHNCSEIPVVIKRKQLCLKYRIHLTFKNHPVHNVIQDNRILQKK